jgi:Uma2 family endonuclease
MYHWTIQTEESGNRGHAMHETQILHPFDTLAPWADAVPGVGPLTVDDLLALPGDGWQYELVEGVLVRMSGSGQLATTIALKLGAVLYAFVYPRRLGVVTGADGVYTFPNASNGLAPDVGFYVAARDALIVDRTRAIPFAPDLAIEVASPRQGARAMAAKARRYVRGGTRLVWVVWPGQQEIDIWRATGAKPAITLGVGDMLSGEDVVPGFTYAATAVFAGPLD